MIKVLVVGQSPPPYVGQAIMIEEMLRSAHPGCRFHHVKMDFSRRTGDHGKASLRKVFGLFALIFKIAIARLSSGSRILYYPPAGPNRVPMFRDIAVLLCTRWMFAKTVFHFHAGGLCELYPKLSAPVRFLFRLAYFHPDAGIRLSDLNPEDAKLLRSRKEFIVPNGIRDVRTLLAPSPRPATDRPIILYAGILRESKGVAVLLEAARLLQARGLRFSMEFMGAFDSEGFEREAREKIRRDGTSDSVRFLGVLSGESKLKAFERADIFGFPSFYESETFGIVLLEAMCFSLPVVATFWRGIPSIVKDGETGFLVPVRDAEALAGKLAILLLDPGLRASLGSEGRKLFETRFTLDQFHRNIIGVFEAIS